MTNTELILNMLAEASTKDISEATDPETFEEHLETAHKGGSVARNARLELERNTGRRVVTPLNAKGIRRPQGPQGGRGGGVLPATAAPPLTSKLNYSVPRALRQCCNYPLPGRRLGWLRGDRYDDSEGCAR